MLWSPVSVIRRCWRRWRGGGCAPSISVLEEAFTGFFTDHHAFLAERMLSRVDAIDADIAALDARIEAEITPFRLGGGPA